MLPHKPDRHRTNNVACNPAAVVTAVGSRTLEKAQAFIKETNSTSAKAYGSYEEVLDDANVHGVYIPLPTSLHLEWVKKAAYKGKHILLEKPIALVSAIYSKMPTVLCQFNAIVCLCLAFHCHCYAHDPAERSQSCMGAQTPAATDEILSICQNANVQLMDGTMWSHSDRVLRMEEAIAARLDPSGMGPLKAVTCTFCCAGQLCLGLSHPENQLDIIAAIVGFAFCRSQ